jgi:hypothetical protein
MRILLFVVFTKYYYDDKKIRDNEMAGNAARMGMITSTHKTLVSRLQGPSRGWYVKMDPKGTAWNDVDWIDLAQDRDQW